MALPRRRAAQQGGPPGPGGGLLAGGVPDRGGAGHRPAATRGRVLVQVDVTGVAGRNGCPPAEVPDLVAALRAEDLAVDGLMAVGPPGPPEGRQAHFRPVSELADRLDLAVRSMGMTDDLEVAVAEGSTMVRVGRALFGRATAPPPVTTRAGGRTGGPVRWPGHLSTTVRGTYYAVRPEDMMAASFMKKTMAYLGLVDSDYDDYDDLDSRGPAPVAGSPSVPSGPDEPEEPGHGGQAPDPHSATGRDQRDGGGGPVAQQPPASARIVLGPARHA